MDTLLDIDDMKFEPFQKVAWDQDLFWVSVYITDSLKYKDLRKSRNFLI